MANKIGGHRETPELESEPSAQASNAPLKSPPSEPPTDEFAATKPSTRNVPPPPSPPLERQVPMGLSQRASSLEKAIADKEGQIRELESKPRTKEEQQTIEKWRQLKAINEKIAFLGDKQRRLLETQDPEERAALTQLLVQLEPLRKIRDELGAQLGEQPDVIKASQELQSMRAKQERVKQVAAGKIKGALRAFVQGQAVRKKVVMPSEIAQYLQDKLGNLKTLENKSVDLVALSKALAREVLQMSEQPNAYGGQGKHLAAGTTYQFPVFDSEGNATTQTVKLPLNVWVRRTPEGNAELELVGQQIGQGAFKQVFRSRPLDVNLQTTQHDKSMQNTVLVKARPGQTNSVLAGMKMIRNNFTTQELQDPELRLAGILTHTQRFADRGQQSLEARDVEYRGDFRKTMQTLRTSQVLQVLADAATTLKKIHAKGLVHGDIKPENLLVSENGRGFVSDFDTTIPVGDEPTALTHDYADGIIQKPFATNFIMKALQFLEGSIGNYIATPFTDIYALARTTAEGLFDCNTSLGASALKTKADKVVNATLSKSLADLKIPFATEGAPETRLAQIDERNLSEQQKAALARIKSQAQSLISCRNAVVGVVEANQSTAKYLVDNPSVLTQLQGKPQERREAMNNLYNRFPAFRDFLGAIQNARASF